MGKLRLSRMGRFWISEDPRRFWIPAPLDWRWRRDPWGHTHIGGVSQRHCCTGCWGPGTKELDSPGAEAAGFCSLSARARAQGGALLVSRAEVLICPGTMSIWPLLQGGCVQHMRTPTGHPWIRLDSGRPDEATSRRD